MVNLIRLHKIIEKNETLINFRIIDCAFFLGYLWIFSAALTMPINCGWEIVTNNLKVHEEENKGVSMVERWPILSSYFPQASSQFFFDYLNTQDPMSMVVRQVRLSFDLQFFPLFFYVLIFLEFRVFVCTHPFLRKFIL